MISKRDFVYATLFPCFIRVFATGRQMGGMVIKAIYLANRVDGLFRKRFVYQSLTVWRGPHPQGDPPTLEREAAVGAPVIRNAHPSGRPAGVPSLRSVAARFQALGYRAASDAPTEGGCLVGYLPMQKEEKMRPSRSSAVKAPVISSSAFWAARRSSARSSPAA